MLTPEQIELKNKIKECEKRLDDVSQEYSDLLDSCTNHHVIPTDETKLYAMCEICENPLGYYCPTNSTHLCESECKYFFKNNCTHLN